MQALDQAKHKSKSENAVIDALMEAEQEFDQKKGDAQASQGQTLCHLVCERLFGMRQHCTSKLESPFFKLRAIPFCKHMI